MSDPQKTGADAPGALIGTTAETTSAVIGLVETLASLFVPGSTLIAGFTLSELGNIAQGLAANIPAVVTAWDDVKAAIDGGTAPTPEQMQALNAATDAANLALEQADQQVIDAAKSKS